MHGLMIYDFDLGRNDDVPFGNKASIIETRIMNRVQPIHFGVNYHENPLEFKLIFGSDKAMDRYDLEDISLWLCGRGKYGWLSIDQPDLDKVQFHCIISELKPITYGWLPVAFEANIICDCPYAYGFPFEYQYTIDGTDEILFRNNSSVFEYIKPVLEFTASQNCDLTITNMSDGNRQFKISGIQSGMLVKVNNNNGIITSENGAIDNLYPNFNGRFFRLVYGDNHISVAGTGDLKITGRFLYNVGG